MEQVAFKKIMFILNMNKNYRPMSFSEGTIITKELQSQHFDEQYREIFMTEHKIEPLFISKNNNKINYLKYLPSKNILLKSFKKLFLFMFHLTLISVFEIIFFFYIASVFENKAIVHVIVDFFNNIPSMCGNMTIEQKEIFTNVFDLFVNVTTIDQNATISSIDRKHFNNELFINAWLYFLVIISIDLIFLLIKFFCKIKVDFKKIILENVVMIIILGIYEYFFLTSIILNYKTISEAELLKTIVSQFNICLIKN